MGSARRTLLAEVLGRKGAKGAYIYDMGDSWEHSIVVEKALPAEPCQTPPVLIGGERQCPPEDCRGLGGR